MLNLQSKTHSFSLLPLVSCDSPWIFFSGADDALCVVIESPEPSKYSTVTRELAKAVYWLLLNDESTQFAISFTSATVIFFSLA